MQLFLTIFYIFWALGLLILLFLIWWTTRGYIKRMEETMLTSRAISAQAALKSAEAAAKLAEVLEAKEHHA